MLKAIHKACDLRLRDRWVPIYFLSVLLVSGGRTCRLDAQTSTTRSSAEKSLPFYIGTYTSGMSQGIYLSSLNPEDGSVSKARLVAELTNPSFLEVHPDGETLYAVSEVAEGNKQVVAYRIQDDYSLRQIAHSSAGGSGPCFVATDPKGSILLVANYGSGGVSSFPIQEDGSLGPVHAISHSGSSIHPRQKGPHGHCILPDPSGAFACAVDLGLDQVIVYPLDDERQRLRPSLSVTHFTPGSGPRHIAFHPDGKHAFVLHELTCKLSLCTWNAEEGILTETASVTTLPEQIQRGFSTAEVLVHPSGEYVYASNRGHNSIAAFRFHGDSLSSLGHTSTQGKTPRNFRIDPTGEYLLAENQSSNSIVVFHLDADSGSLTETEHRLEVGSPVCIKFAKASTDLNRR